MSLDTTVLRILKHRDKYDLYHHVVPGNLLEATTRIILDDLGRFFSESGVQVATTENFWPWFLLAHPKLKDEAKSKLQIVVRTMQANVGVDLETGLLARLEDARQAAALTAMLEKYNAGEEVSVTKTIGLLAESIPLSKDQMPRITTDINQLLDEEQNDWGFHWRLACLSQSMRPSRPGDFIITAARVDQGKTTWLASELSHMAPQVDKLFPGGNRPIIVLNNESVGERVKSRLVQATLGKSIKELVDMRDKGTRIWDETLKMWGGREVVEVYDVHDRPLSYLENIIRRRSPAICVVDMLDNVPFDGAVANGGQRTDQILEAAYQRARIWAVKYNCIMIAMSQLSATAAGVLYPGLHELANSRTGKAGAADAVIMIGASDDPLMKNSRWISLPKNKLHRHGFPKDPRTEVIFDGLRARFRNPIEGESDGKDSAA